MPVVLTLRHGRMRYGIVDRAMRASPWACGAGMTEYVDEIRLRKHVEALASDIGERNVSKPESLTAASSYIEAEWRTQGYDVAKQVYEADGVACANL